MSDRSSTLRTLVALTLLLGCGAAFGEEQSQTITVPLTRPSEPVSLKIDLRSARIEVIGEDRQDVAIDATRVGGERKLVMPSGSKTLPGGSYELEIHEDDNTVTVDTDGRMATFAIVARVPRRANLNLSTHQDGEIRVRDITGDLQLENHNGPITATSINGSVIAESVNKAITVSLTGVSNSRVISLSSLNGDVSLSVPANAGVEFRLDTAKGEIESAFEMDVNQGKPVIERSAGRDGRGDMSVRVEDVIVASINGGGPVIRIKTLNGAIRIGKTAR